MFRILSLITFMFLFHFSWASKLLIPMDNGEQNNHLKAYGIAYWVLQNDIEIEWLLNYRGGSFLMDNYKTIEEECIIVSKSKKVLITQIMFNLKFFKCLCVFCTHDCLNLFNDVFI